jgi:hypothetical protein
MKYTSTVVVYKGYLLVSHKCYHIILCLKYYVAKIIFEEAAYVIGNLFLYLTPQMHFLCILSYSTRSGVCKSTKYCSVLNIYMLLFHTPYKLQI